MSRRVDEQALRALFEEIEAPAGLDRWRERIADVDAEHDPALVAPVEDDEPEVVLTFPAIVADTEDKPVDEPAGEPAVVVTLPVDQGLRPKRHRRRSVAVAAAAAVVVGLGGVVVTNQLLTADPPADPTMIIDGPDKTLSSTPPSPTAQSPTGTATTPPTQGGDGPRVDDQNRTDENEGGTADGGPDPGPGAGGPQPSWPPMTGDPSAANTGVPVGAVLGDHHGDLRITIPGQVVTDLRVTGTVIVDAPNVTLKRVIVVAPYGSTAVRQNAGNLTIEDSELSGGQSLTQAGGGLTVRRSRVEFGMTITTGAQVHDSYFNSSSILIPSGSNNILLRHNVFGSVTMNDLDGAIRSVTVENNVLAQLDAPTGAGSAGIHVLGNRFTGSAPSTGWNRAAPDYRWSGNTFADTGAPAEP